MFKKKCYGLLVISLLVLFLGLSCTSYTMAYSLDELYDFATQVSSDSSASVRQRSLANMLLAHKDGWTTYITTKVGNLNSIKGLWVFYNSGSATTSPDRLYLYIWTFVPSLDFSSSAGSGMSPSSINRPNYGLQFINNGFDTIGSVGESMQRNMGFGLIETSNTSTIYSGWYLQNRYVPSPQYYFTPNYDDIVTQNNIDYNTLLRNWSVNQWKIGETTNFSQLDSFQMYFYDLVANVELGFVEGVRSINSIRGTNCLYFNEGNLYVNSRYMRYNNAYRLDIYKYLDGVETTEIYYYLFLPRNAVISNGVIINTGSGDFNTQDATNAIIDDMSNTANLSGELAGISSGDIYNKLGFKTYNTNWATFIWNMLLSLKDKLLLDNGAVTFTFPYMKTYITVSSADFTVPNGLLKGFISTFLTFGLIVLIYQRITALYHRLEEGNVSEVLTWSDVDDETFLM